MQITRFDQAQETLDRLCAEGFEVLASARRSDGYTFFVSRHKSHAGLRLHAGCRQNWSLGYYRRHVKWWIRRSKSRKTQGKFKETIALIASLEATALAKWS